MENISPAAMISFAAQIISAHVSNNPVPAAELPSLIREVHKALSTLGAPAPAAPQARPEPPIPVRKSIHPDYLICLEDGKKLKMLKRHLKTAYNMTPEQYREKWGLASDYPMVAPNYAAKRSSLAKAIGLGSARTRSAKPD